MLSSFTIIMAKGKSKSRPNFSGVSRFLDAFETDTGSASSYKTPDSTIKETDDESRPAKKRKTGTQKPLPRNSAYKGYDATGLVPYYTEPSQVPEDLQKCASRRSSGLKPLNRTCIISLTQISLNGADTSRSTTRAAS